MTQRKVAELNASILKIASNVSLAIEAEVEDTLEDAEKVVKKFVPARYVKRTLAAIEQRLDKEGIEVEFEKGITREALRKTASDEAGKDELDDLVEKVVDAIVSELEDVLGDADEVMDDSTSDMGDDEPQLVEVEAKLKSIVEHKLAAVGVHARFARNAKTIAASKKAARRSTLAERIANSYKG